MLDQEFFKKSIQAAMKQATAFEMQEWKAGIRKMKEDLNWIENVKDRQAIIMQELPKVSTN